MNLFYLLVIGIILSGCADKCVEADDFGFPKLYISARGQRIERLPNGQQVVPWQDSNLILDGTDLVVLVANWVYHESEGPNRPGYVSAWCPWMGHNANNKGVISSPFFKSPRCKIKELCKIESMVDKDRIQNAPCLMSKGIGLYMLVPKGDQDPNATVNRMFSTTQYSFHLGPATASLEGVPGFYSREYDYAARGIKWKPAGGIALDHIGHADIASFAGSKLYFKIYDNRYDDNSGQYIVYVKNGVRKVGGLNGIAFMKDVRTILFGDHKSSKSGVYQRIYNGITQNKEYTRAVHIALIIFVMMFSILFLLGMVQFSVSELFVRSFKLVVVSLIATNKNSWEIFDKYCLSLFLDGSQTLIEQIGTGSQDIISIIFAPQTIVKLMSLIFVGIPAVMYAVVFGYLSFHIIKVYLSSIVTIIVAMMVFGVAVALTPIFICFMLFNFTHGMYEKWRQQFVVFIVRPLILIACVGMLNGMIKNEIYRTLGFRVCSFGLFDFASWMSSLVGKEDEFDTLISNKSFLSIYYPDPYSKDGFDLAPDAQVEMLVANPSDGSAPYTKKEKRYPDLPFLKPDSDDDMDLINKVRADGISSLVTFSSTIRLVIVVIFMRFAINWSDSIGRIISGASAYAANISGVGNQAAQGIGNNLNRIATSPAAGMLLGGIGRIGAYLGGAILSPAAKLLSGIGKTIMKAGADVGRSIAKGFTWLANTRPGKYIGNLRPIRFLGEKIVGIANKSQLLTEKLAKDLKSKITEAHKGYQKRKSNYARKQFEKVRDRLIKSGSYKGKFLSQGDNVDRYINSGYLEEDFGIRKDYSIWRDLEIRTSKYLFDKKANKDKIRQKFNMTTKGYKKNPLRELGQYDRIRSSYIPELGGFDKILRETLTDDYLNQLAQQKYNGQNFDQLTMSERAKLLRGEEDKLATDILAGNRIATKVEDMLKRKDPKNTMDPDKLKRIYREYMENQIMTYMLDRETKFDKQYVVGVNKILTSKDPADLKKQNQITYNNMQFSIDRAIPYQNPDKKIEEKARKRNLKINLALQDHIEKGFEELDGGRREAKRVFSLKDNKEEAKADILYMHRRSQNINKVVADSLGYIESNRQGLNRVDQILNTRSIFESRDPSLHNDSIRSIYNQEVQNRMDSYLKTKYGLTQTEIKNLRDELLNNHQVPVYDNIKQTNATRFSTHKDFESYMKEQIEQIPVHNKDWSKKLTEKFQHHYNELDQLQIPNDDQIYAQQVQGLINGIDYGQDMKDVINEVNNNTPPDQIIVNNYKNQLELAIKTRAESKLMQQRLQAINQEQQNI